MDATSFSSSSDPHECYMTEKILMEILSRLPVKSIFKFKSVSREWFSLLSSSYFVDFYKTRMSQWTLVHKNLYHHEPHYYWYSIPPPPNYDLFNNLNSFGSKSPSFSILPPRWSLEFPEEENQKKAVIIEEILGSSNGWLLCTSINPHLTARTILHLINPLTMQCISIPDSFFLNEICFGFVTKAEGDVITSFRLVTLIWCSFTRFDVSTPFLEFGEFCSETRAWKKSRIDIDQFDQQSRSVRISPRFGKVAFTLGNVLHWFNGATILVYYPDYGGSGHKCRVISLPADRTIWTNDHYEGRDCLPENWMMWVTGRYERRRELSSYESSGSDSMCGVAQDGYITYVEMIGLGKRGFKEGGLTVWKLRDYNKGEWSLEHRVENRDIVFDPRLRKPLTRLLAFHPLDSEILYLGQRCDFIFSYNIRLRKSEVVQSPMREDDEGRVIGCRGGTLPFVLQWPTRFC